MFYWHDFMQYSLNLNHQEYQSQWSSGVIPFSQLRNLEINRILKVFLFSVCKHMRHRCYNTASALTNLWNWFFLLPCLFFLNTQRAYFFIHNLVVIFQYHQYVYFIFFCFNAGKKEMIFILHILYFNSELNTWGHRSEKLFNLRFFYHWCTNTTLSS